MLVKTVLVQTKQLDRNCRSYVQERITLRGLQLVFTIRRDDAEESQNWCTSGHRVPDRRPSGATAIDALA
jgi:hypothetical protein